MKRFFQQNISKTLLKASLGLVILLLVIQQGFGQCVQCDGTTTSGLFPSAIGRYTKATANYSFAGGIYSEANGSASIAFGNRTYANGANSVVLGMFLKSNSSPAIVLGAGFDENNRLENSLPYSMMIGFGSTKPTFFVGPSSGVNNTGKIGIGNVTDPQAKLHIRADDGEDASLLLESGSSNHEANIRLGQNHKISATEAGNLNFETADNKHFVFHQGDIFLEDIQSGIIMKSPNGQCWRGTLNDQGTLNFAQTTCPEGTSTAVQSHNSEKLMLVYPNPTGDKVTVEVSLHGQAAVLQLTSQDGKVLRQQILNTNIAQISLSQLPRGMYLINLLQDGKTLATGKVVKE